MMDSRATRIAAFAGVFVAALALSVRCTLPTPFLTRIAEAQLEEAVGHNFKVHIDSVGLRGLSGVRARNLELESRRLTLPAGAPLRIRAASVKAGVSLFALVGGKLDVDAAIEIGGGRVEADFVGKDGGPAELDLRIFDVHIGQLPFLLARVGVPLAGTLRGTVTGRVNEESRLETGMIDLNLLNTQLGPGGVPSEMLPADLREAFDPELKVPAVNIGNLLVSAPINGSQLDIETFRQVGTDISSSGTARVQLQRPPGDSPLQGNLRLSVESEFVERAELGPLFSMIPALRGVANGGEVNFALAGTLRRPQPLNR